MMTQLSNKAIAEQAAIATGVVVMLVGLLSAVLGVVFATGIATVHIGIAYSCLSSARDVGAELQLGYTILSLIASLALIAMVCWIVWGYTATVVSFSVVMAAAATIYVSVYCVAHKCLPTRFSSMPSRDNGSTEP